MNFLYILGRFLFDIMKIVQEYVSLSDENPFLVSIFNDPDLSYPLHHHQDAYELTMTLGLSGTRMVGDSTEQFSSFDLVLIAPGIPHCWQDHNVRDASDHQVTVVQFSDELIPILSRSMLHFKRIAAALQHAKFGLEMVGSNKEKAREIIHGFDGNNTLDTYLGILKVLYLFGDSSSVRQLCSEAYRQPSLNDEKGRLEKALKYIHSHYSKKISLDEVAELTHMSASAFSHYFKKRTRKNFTDFLVELRLGKAAQLLQLSDMPVARVGFECGFQNIPHFSRSFSKKYKRSPLQFRKQVNEWANQKKVADELSANNK